METRDVTRSGHRAAMMSAVREPQSKPASTAFSIFRASIREMTSSAMADCSAVRGVWWDRKVVLPCPRRYGTITR